MSVVAIIPARGGSKGVPRKNLREVAGIPLIVRAVRACRDAAAIDEVVVTTDDAEIAAAARAAGARIVERPADLAGDTASSESALLHALDALEADGVAADTVVFVQATSPFIASADLDRAVAAVRDEGYDSAFSAFETYAFVWRRTAEGTASAVGHDAAKRPRRQDREPHYQETGAFYAFSAEGFRAARHRFFGRIAIVEVGEASALEIDDVVQLEMASALAPLIEGAGAERAAGAGTSDSAGTSDTPARIDVDAVVTDFDGVHTDDTAWVDAHGRESVRVSRSDGMGVALLRRAGIPLLILSTETNPVVRARADKLHVEVLHGVDDKAAALEAWARRTEIPLERVAYLGNDVNDLPAMRLVGWPVAVADAHPQVLAAARVTLSRRGGDGAVRELADRVLPS